jgi:hypothetical protein
LGIRIEYWYQVQGLRIIFIALGFGDLGLGDRIWGLGIRSRVLEPGLKIRFWNQSLGPGLEAQLGNRVWGSGSGIGFWNQVRGSGSGTGFTIVFGDWVRRTYPRLSARTPSPWRCTHLPRRLPPPRPPRQRVRGASSRA